MSQSQIVGSVEASRPVKHTNKYSFKRNSTTRSKTDSLAFRESESNVLAQQEAVIAKVRELAVTRRGFLPNAAASEEGVKLWNTLTEIYNLTLGNNAASLQPLQFITIANPPENRPPQASFQKTAQRPL